MRNQLTVVIGLMIFFQPVYARDANSASTSNRYKALFDKKTAEAMKEQEQLDKLIDSVRDSSPQEQQKVVEKLQSKNNNSKMAPSLIGANAISFMFSKYGILNRLDARIRERLGRTGLPVYQTQSSPRVDCIEVIVTVTPSEELATLMQKYYQAQGVARMAQTHDVQLVVYQPCSIPRIPGSIIRAQTYRLSRVARNSEDLENKIFDLVDTFIIDFLTANSE